MRLSSDFAFNLIMKKLTKGKVKKMLKALNRLCYSGDCRKTFKKLFALLITMDSPGFSLQKLAIIFL